MSIEEYRFQSLSSPEALKVMTQQSGEVLTRPQMYERFDELSSKYKRKQPRMKPGNERIPF